MHSSRETCTSIRKPKVKSGADSSDERGGFVAPDMNLETAQSTSKKSGGSSFRKLFMKESKAHLEDGNRDNEDSIEEKAPSDQNNGDAMDELKGIIHQNPITRPLGHKLEARVERPRWLTENVSTTQSESTTSAGESDTHERRAPFSDGCSSGCEPKRHSQWSLLSLIPDPEFDLRYIKSSTTAAWDSVPGQYYGDDKLNQFNQHNPQSPVAAPKSNSHNILNMNSQINSVARQAAPDEGMERVWVGWLHGYITGSFTVSTPPKAPFLNPSFQYLPALKPQNEELRFARTTTYRSAWRAWENFVSEKSALLASISDRFSIRFATINTAEEDRIVVQAGSSTCGGEPLRRELSVGAHMLLTNETMVICDASKDWRFKNNPLVNGKLDRIRFFAAAPLLSQDGLAIGFLAIADYQPRFDFANNQKFELQDHANRVMGRLNCLSSLCKDNTVARQYENRIVHPVLPGQNEFDDDVDLHLLPVALRCSKPKTPPTTAIGDYIEHPSNYFFPNHNENTPPSSIVSGEDPPFSQHYNKSQNRILNINFSVQPDKQPIERPFDLATPESDDGRSRSSRPWSSSDITSYHPHPPNTPAASFKEDFEQSNYCFTIADFNALDDADCVEDQIHHEPLATSSVNAVGNGSSSSDRTDESLATELHRMRPLLGSPQGSGRWLRRVSSNLPMRKNEKIVLPPLPQLPSEIQTSSPGRSSSDSEDSMNKKDMAFAFKHAATNLGYDLMYALELAPARSMMTDVELHEMGGLRTRVLGAYGMGKPLEGKFNPSVHLTALRASNSVTYDFPEGGDYRQCIIKWISWEGADGHKQCSSGVIIAAYSAQEHEESRWSDAVRAKRFDEAVDILKPLVLRARGQSSQRSPIFPRYPANEATEVSISSLLSEFDLSSHSISLSASANKATEVNYSSRQSRLDIPERKPVRYRFGFDSFR